MNEYYDIEFSALICLHVPVHTLIDYEVDLNELIRDNIDLDLPGSIEDIDIICNDSAIYDLAGII